MPVYSLLITHLFPESGRDGQDGLTQRWPSSQPQGSELVCPPTQVAGNPKAPSSTRQGPGKPWELSHPQRGCLSTRGSWGTPHRVCAPAGAVPAHGGLRSEDRLWQEQGRWKVVLGASHEARRSGRLLSSSAGPHQPDNSKQEQGRTYRTS